MIAFAYPMPARKKAILYLIFSAILWSFGGLLIKLVDWNPMAIAGARSAIAAVFLYLTCRQPNWTWSIAQIGGGLAYAATMILFVVANKLTTAANVILLQYSAPIYIALFSSWFLNEKIRLIDWAAIVVVLGGMSLFFLDSLSASGLLGNVLAIITGVTLAWLFLFSRKQKSGSALESLILGNLIAALIGFPFMFSSMPDTQSILGLLLLGLLQLGLPYLLFSIAIKHVSALDAILIPTIEPLLNPIWVLLLLGEKPGFWAIIGGAIVLTAVTARGIIRARWKEPVEYSQNI